MYGIKSHSQACTLNTAREKLEQLKEGSRKIDAVIQKQEEISAQFEDLKKEFSQLEIKFVEQYDPIKEQETDDQLKELYEFLHGNEKDKKVGMVENMNNKIQAQQEELLELMSQYVENSTPRQDRTAYELLEKRIAKLEEKPKFSVRPSSRDAQSVGAEKRIANFEIVTKK